jgi:hypothetical protein
MTAGVGALACVPDWLDRLENLSRQRIAKNQFVFSRTLDQQERMNCEIAIIFWRLLVPFMRGIAAGYLSHLALDAATPRGIPFVFGCMSSPHKIL